MADDPLVLIVGELLILSERMNELTRQMNRLIEAHNKGVRILDSLLEIMQAAGAVEPGQSTLH